MDRRILLFAVIALAIVVGATQAQAGLLKIEANANGVKVEVDGLIGSAPRVSYDKETERLVLEGHDDVPATLVRKLKGGQEEWIRGTKIIFSLKEGSCRVENCRKSKP
jgi:lipopolysaccharide export system protein LptA